MTTAPASQPDAQPRGKIRFALRENEDLSTKPTFAVQYVDESSKVAEDSWMKDPWAPMIGATLAFAGVVLWKRRRLNMPQAMMHARIIAQGTTVAALFGAACMHGFADKADDSTTSKGLADAL